MVFLEPLGVNRRYVPHLKGLISGKVEPKDQGRGSTITLCHGQNKNVILLLKTAIISMAELLISNPIRASMFQIVWVS